MTPILHCSPPPLLLGGEFWFTTLEAMEMLGVSPLLAQVWFLSLPFQSELVVSYVKLNDVKQKYLWEITLYLFDCLPSSH